MGGCPYGGLPRMGASFLEVGNTLKIGGLLCIP